MSILTEYLKAIYIENILKLINLVLRVECTLYSGCVMEFTSGLRERQKKKSLAIMIKNKKINY